MKRSGILALWLILSLVSDFRLRIQGRGYDSGQCGSDPGAYEALVGGCAGACAFRFRSGNAFRAPDCVGAACHGAFAV